MSRRMEMDVCTKGQLATASTGTLDTSGEDNISLVVLFLVLLFREK